MNLDNRLAGTVALVTGGGSGIGRGACERIAAEGGAVTVAESGSLTGLVANAGTVGNGWVHETAVEDWHFVPGGSSVYECAALQRDCWTLD